MDVKKILFKLLEILPARIVSILEKNLMRFPAFQNIVDKELEPMLQKIGKEIKGRRYPFPVNARIPQFGRDKQEILRQIQLMKNSEEKLWKKGYISGAVYHGNNEHIEFLNQVYALTSQANPLHSDIWPSISQFEAEIVRMTANMLGSDAVLKKKESEVCGAVTSGGTESILLAMKVYRDFAYERRRISKPEIIVPASAHAAFDKAGDLFGIRVVRIPVDKDYRADIKATKKAITRNTIALIGSAPSFPHGVIDPIADLSEIARENGIGFHTDACLGGFVLPWIRKIGIQIPAFDFELPGVTSISADTHKYGYAAKGTSVILYRNPNFLRYQYFVTADWSGGLYASPTLAGSRPGALSAMCWAAMLSIGEEGYLNAIREILKTAAVIKEGIKTIKDIYILGDPLWIIALSSNTVDIYRVMDCMAEHGWNLNSLQKPPAFHLCITQRHTQSSVAERFLDDLRSSVKEAKQYPVSEKGMAPIYGTAAKVPLRGAVRKLLKEYINLLYKI